MSDTFHTDTFRSWIRNEIIRILQKKTSLPPFVIWCDPAGVWKELLQKAAEDDMFELWSDETHELLLREKFWSTPRSPRVVWVPVSRDEITYFKVFELQAEIVKEMSLISALSSFGVEIPSDQAVMLEPFLPSHAKEWLDYPLQYWKDNLSKGQVKMSLVDDDLFLLALASVGNSLDSIITEDRFSVLSRRAVEDFGFPALPEPKDNVGFPGVVETDTWRYQSVATLLVTDAFLKNSSNAPGDKDRIIAAGAAREQAMKLLTRWQKQIDLVESFELLAIKADALTTLPYWAKSLEQLPPACNSPCVEFTLFQNEVESLAKFDSFDDLSSRLENRIPDYQSHAQGYWGSRAINRVHWKQVLDLAKMASLLKEYTLIESGWKTTADAVYWFTAKGWEADQVGEELFRENVDLGDGLIGVIRKLRKAYSRHLDRTNQKFSELIANAGVDSIHLPFAGDVIGPIVEKASSKEPVAVLILDACRYDLGCRLASLMNQGEPSQRATVKQAMAPVPSITALGMPFALPGLPSHLQVELNGSPATWRITAQGYLGDLSIAAKRQEWLQKNFKLKGNAFLSIGDVVDRESIEKISSKTLGRLVFVIGDDLDDHDGSLKPFGLDQVLERYARAIRRLRSAGYSTVAVVTDHGFFHWYPDADEVQPKPAGEILWSSRRAIAGHNLTNPAAIACEVTKSALECSIPRSVNAFRTYGGLGFFHGGATLQEMVIPVVIAQWPKKAQKIGAVIKPVVQLISLTQKFDVGPSAAQAEFFGTVDGNLLSRLVMLKISDSVSGKLLFRSKTNVPVVPGGTFQSIEMEKIEGAEAKVGVMLDIILLDADDEEVLDSNKIELKIELDEWF